MFKFAILKNHILLLFKIYVYKSIKHEKISVKNLSRNLTKIKNVEREIAGNNDEKIRLCNEKWKKIENKSNEKS